MNGLDTNLLVRYLVKDDPDQAGSAIAFMRANCTSESPCRINRIVLCELAWVLDSAYRYPRQVIADVLGKILRTGEFVIENADEAWHAHRAYLASGLSRVALRPLARRPGPRARGARRRRRAAGGSA